MEDGRIRSTMARAIQEATQVAGLGQERSLSVLMELPAVVWWAFGFVPHEPSDDARTKQDGQESRKLGSDFAWCIESVAAPHQERQQQATVTTDTCGREASSGFALR